MIGYRLPSVLKKEIEDLDGTVGSFQSGLTSEREFKAIRVPFGVYEQRKEGTYMVRVRCAAGIITPANLENLSALAHKYGSSSLHLTTRQEIQLHNLDLEDIVPVMRDLEQLGLSSRGGGGNTVRNIIAEDGAGVEADEVFDVTPHALALTDALIAESDSWNLPRKYKIAFSGSVADRGFATLNDLGFIAVEENGQRGFQVYVAGGMGAKPDSGKLLFDFLPEDRVYQTAKALKNLFYKHGNRKNKHAARLRFLWKKWGEEKFRAVFLEEFDALNELPALSLPDIENTSPIFSRIQDASSSTDDSFQLWKKRFVHSQRQEELNRILIPVELGQLDAEKAGELGHFLSIFGENSIRLTREQNIMIRNIPDCYLPIVFRKITNLFPGMNRPVILDRMIACTGADTCKQGVCLSQKALQFSVIPTLAESGSELDGLEDLRINFSGCPNSCGQHHAGNLGFFGKVGRKNDRIYPAYTVLAGGHVEAGKTVLAKTVGDISARNLASFVKDFLKHYKEKIAEGSVAQTFDGYISSGGLDEIKTILEKYADVPDFESDKNFYFDHGSDAVFSLVDRGIGECSAGLFDLIEFDQEKIQQLLEVLKGEPPRDIPSSVVSELIFHTSRMLLITRGVESGDRRNVLQSFLDHFVDAGLVDSRFRAVVQAELENKSAFDEDVVALAADMAKQVLKLYERMDNSLNFPGESFLAPDPPASVESVHKSRDLRGIKCPLNFVHTKLELAKIAVGERLEITLDDGPPIENVPRSVESEGHRILKTDRNGSWWTVLIEKGG